MKASPELKKKRQREREQKIEERESEEKHISTNKKVNKIFCVSPWIY